METALNFQRSFERTKQVKKIESGKLLRNWYTEYKEKCKLNTSAYAVQTFSIYFLFHIFNM